MRPIKGLQLILSVAIMVSVWGCFLSLFVLTWYGFLDPLIGVIGVHPVWVATVLWEVPLLMTVGWLAWLFPPLGNAFKTVFWFGFSLIGALLGIRQQHNAWKFNMWAPLSVVLVVVTAISFWVVQGGIAGLVIVTFLLSLGFIVYKAFHKKGVFNSQYKEEQVAKLTEGRLKFRSHPIGLIVFGLEDLWGPFKIIIGLLPLYWVMLFAAAAVGGSFMGHSLRPLLLTPLFWLTAPLTTVYWFIWYGVRGSNRGVFCTDDGKLICIEPEPGLYGWLGEVFTGEVDGTLVQTGQTHYDSTAGVAKKWNPGTRYGPNNDPVLVRYIKRKAIAMIATWVTLQKQKAKAK